MKLIKIDINDGRQCFYESWIRETPEADSPRNDYQQVAGDLQEFLTRNKEKPLTQDIYYAESSSLMYVFSKHQISPDADIIVCLEKTPQNLSVLSTASRPNKITPPYTTDLYMAALKLAKEKSIVFRSDKTVTDTVKNLNGDTINGAISVWKRLKTDYPEAQVSVYNTDEKQQTGQTLIPINDVSDLYDYFGISPDSDKQKYKKWRFVLSENKKHFYDSVYDLFSIRRMRELTNVTLDEDYE